MFADGDMKFVTFLAIAVAAVASLPLDGKSPDVVSMGTRA